MVNAFVDFDGGGRFLCEVTDVNPIDVETEMPVEMTFRKLSESDGINSYFWKARPVTS